MLYGIDISSWQEGINISAISNQCDFLIAKCTDGTYFKDEPFEQYMQDGYTSNMLLGMYHFAENQSAAKQAEYFFNACRAWIGKAIPFLDLEESSIPDWEEFATEFCTTFQSLSGVKPVLYISNGFTNYFSSNFAKKYNLWVAEYWYNNISNYTSLLYSDWPICSPWKDAKIWQFTSSGKLNGFNGNLDLDYFDGSRDDWNELCGGVDMAISDADVERIAKKCAEYVYGENDTKKNLNMYNAIHWAYNNTVRLMSDVAVIKKKLENK